MERQPELMDFSQYPKTFELAKGEKVEIRPMRPEDRDRLFSFFRDLSRRDRRFFKHDVSQREVITNWCTNLDYDRVLPLLALIRQGGHERVVADGTLHTERHGWSTHVAEIRMVIAKKYRKKGLGKILLRELYDRAIERGVEKIQSLVRADDQTAIDLLQRLGFKEEAVFKKHALDHTGRKHDVVVMYNDLGELWRSMEDLNFESDFTVVP